MTSAYISPCVNDLVSEDADLVLVEFTLNDTERGSRALEDPVMYDAHLNSPPKTGVCWQLDDAEQPSRLRRALERILRKLQRLPKNPAIILIHYWAARMDHGYSGTAEEGINTLLKVKTNGTYLRMESAHAQLQSQVLYELQSLPLLVLAAELTTQSEHAVLSLDGHLDARRVARPSQQEFKLHRRLLQGAVGL